MKHTRQDQRLESLKREFLASCFATLTMTWKPERSEKVQFEPGAEDMPGWDAASLRELSAYLLTIAGALEAAEASWRRDRLVREAGFRDYDPQVSDVLP
jgi:hypothetical protein